MNQLNFSLTVFVSAAAGTALVEVFVKLFLGHVLKKARYKFEVNFKDKRGVADEILNLLNDPQLVEWPPELHNKANALSDRLVSLKQEEASKLLDKYSTGQFFLKNTVLSILNKPGQGLEKTQDYVKTAAEQDKLRKQLVDVSKKLKK